METNIEKKFTQTPKHENKTVSQELETGNSLSRNYEKGSLVSGFITLSQASKLSGYARGYLNLLSRKGVLKSQKVGRNWHTTEEWLSDFSRMKEIEKRYEKARKSKMIFGKAEKIKKEKFITLSQAAKMSGYARGYLNLLSRKGVLKSQKRGRNWHTTEEWLAQLISLKEIEKEEEKTRKSKMIFGKSNEAKESEVEIAIKHPHTNSDNSLLSNNNKNIGVGVKRFLSLALGSIILFFLSSATFYFLENSPLQNTSLGKILNAPNLKINSSFTDKTANNFS
ncbi:MAG: hypothetical protein V1698_00090, partial [bacterium]